MVLLLSSLMALFLRRLYTYWIKAKMARFSLTHKMVNFSSSNLIPRRGTKGWCNCEVLCFDPNFLAFNILG